MRTSILAFILALCCLLSSPLHAQYYDVSNTVSNSIIYRDTTMPFDQAVTNQIALLNDNNPADTGEGSSVASFSRWAEFMSYRICTDAPQGQNQLAPASAVLINYLKTTGQYCQNSNGYTGDWTNVGPFINSYGGTDYEHVGRFNCIWVDSPNIAFMLAGADNGGLWESTDTGHNWTNISDNASGSIIPGTIGITGIAVNPLNKSIIYLITGVSPSSYTDYSYGYSTGVVYTTNGGTS